MLEYGRIDISEGIDINRTNASKESDICHHWSFFGKKPYLYNSYHDLMEKATNFNGFAIVSVNGSHYRIHFWYMSKNDATNIMNNCNLNEKSERTCYQRERETEREKERETKRDRARQREQKLSIQNYLKRKKIKRIW